MPTLADRYALENQFIADLRPIFAAEFERARRAPTAIPYGQFQQQLAGVMAVNLQQAFQAGGATLLIGNSLTVSQGAFASTARQWSLGFANELASRAVATSRALADSAVSRVMYSARPAERQAKIDLALAGIFMADARLENIAITEVTRGISQGENAVILFLPDAQRDSLVAIWQTAEDDRVCEICAPFDGHTDVIWRRYFPQGPPAHTRCRCKRLWVPIVLVGRRAA